MTGGRLKRVADYVGDETFCFTYGDCVADLDIDEADRVPPRAGRARDADCGPAAGPLRRARLWTATRAGSRSFHEKPRRRRRLDQRRLLRARARGVRLHRRRRDRVGARAAGAPRRRGQLVRLPAPRLLAEHGHACATRWSSRSTGRPASRRGRSGERDRGRPARFCLRLATLTQIFVDLGHARRWRTRYLAEEDSRATEPFYPLHALRLRASACSCSSSEFDLAAGHLQRLRLLLVVLGQLARARSPLRREMIERFGLGARLRWSSSPATTATCSSTSSSAACRCSASSRRPTWPRSPTEKGIPTDRRVLRRADRARRSSRQGVAPTC